MDVAWMRRLLFADPSPGSSARQGRARPRSCYCYRKWGGVCWVLKKGRKWTHSGCLLCSQHWHYGPHLVSGTQRDPPVRKHGVRPLAFCYLYLEESLEGSAWKGDGGHVCWKKQPPESEPGAQARHPLGRLSDRDRKGTRRDDWRVGGETETEHPRKTCSPWACLLLPTAPLHTIAGSCPAPRRAQDGPDGRRTSLPRYTSMSVILKQLQSKTLSLSQVLRKESNKSRLWEKTDVKPSDPTSGKTNNMEEQWWVERLS